ncbi:a20-like zinc finger [Ancylostoma caninum]|uniref:A20-like zinc finger n=1 Tax=Ancylostoma caninum TaxID=29170 RepID=A0A368G228_ANCCA|nr:a20-like zinc finger [Ancylostoma caninum]
MTSNHDDVFVDGEETELSRRLKVQINEKDLLCVNGCGFYGTPQWGNRCSKCWREHQIAEKRSQDYAKNKVFVSVPGAFAQLIFCPANCAAAYSKRGFE